MSDILIKNAYYILIRDEAGRELQGADIHIHDGEIIAVETDYKPPVSCYVAQAKGCAVTLGLVNTHHHLYQSLTRAVPGAQNALLFGWLQTL